jgi:hypothetical protein
VGADDRVQDALAAYLEHLEMGGAEPDVSHLTDDERSELAELVDALELTEGIAFGRGPGEPSTAPEPAGPEGERLLDELRGVLPPGARLSGDDNRLVGAVGGLEVLERFVVGTFGGRVRVWLVDAAGADAVESADALGDLAHVFRMFPDMAAIALVGRDLTCLVVEPEDTGPRIRVPSGSLVSRRYNRAIGPVAEALGHYLDELVPYWDPMPAFDRDGGVLIDIGEIAAGHVRAAVERQRGLGERARKGNPKKDALRAFGDTEVRAVDAIVTDLFDGSIDPVDVETRIERETDR